MKRKPLQKGAFTLDFEHRQTANSRCGVNEAILTKRAKRNPVSLPRIKAIDEPMASTMVVKERSNG
jgi:hypothetical protein